MIFTLNCSRIIGHRDVVSANKDDLSITFSGELIQVGVVSKSGEFVNIYKIIKDGKAFKLNYFIESKFVAIHRHK